MLWTRPRMRLTAHEFFNTLLITHKLLTHKHISEIHKNRVLATRKKERKAAINRSNGSARVWIDIVRICVGRTGGNPANNSVTAFIRISGSENKM